jgi:HPt (histidine-containing phosphotransfer) domain-containing protein
VGLSYFEKPERLRRMLVKFRDAHCRTFDADFDRAVAAGDWDAQVRLAHGLKGLARTMGALDLGETAAILEEKATEQDMDAVRALRASASKALRVVADGLAGLDGDAAGAVN